MTNTFDVIVVGAGPGGSVAALCLARAGHRVLLIDKQSFPRDKSCGDGLTRMSCRLLHKLGLWHKFNAFKKIEGVRVNIDKQGSREFEYPNALEDPAYGLVVPRIALDHILVQAAVAQGVVLQENKKVTRLIHRNGKVSGVTLNDNVMYHSDVVIAADGAASLIAYEAGLASTPKEKLGFGLRCYYNNISGLTGNLEIYLPIIDKSEKYVLPSYGWVFPMGNGKANIGVGLIEKTETDNIQSVMDAFVGKLKRTNDGFKDMVAEGKYFGAPMRFDFNPDRSFCPGLMLVGDAAGLISPFTGEGIGYAMETGMIASDVYHSIKTTSQADFSNLSRYGYSLSERFQGYFETGTASVNRYHLMWKVIKSTFQNDKPLYEVIRRATLFPEAIGESVFEHLTRDTSTQIRVHAAELKTDLLTISKNLISITRHEWPFLSRLFTAQQVTPGIPFRPSLFLLLAGYYANAPRETLVELGTAVELGYMATLCHTSVMEADEEHTAINWGNMLSVLAGDFVLSKAYERMSPLDQKLVQIIAEKMAAAAHGDVSLKRRFSKGLSSLAVDEYLNLLYLKNSSSFEACLLLGAQSGDVGFHQMEALRVYGRHFGACYQIIEDGYRYGIKNKLFNDTTTWLNTGNENQTLLHFFEDHQHSNENGVVECMQYSLTVANDEMTKALNAIESLTVGPVKESLINIGNQLILEYETKVYQAKTPFKIQA